MRVYRLCREEEIKKILHDNSFSNVGNFCKNTEINSYNYKENIKYLHFFKSKTDLLYLNTLKGRFICVYDIPTDILTKYQGIGKYASYYEVASLGINEHAIPSNLIEVEEYAIPTNLIKIKHLQVIAKLIENVDIEDFYDNNYLSKCIKIIYDKTTNKGEHYQSAIFDSEDTFKNKLNVINYKIENLDLSNETNPLEK